jgi:hypothetical protein
MAARKKTYKREGGRDPAHTPRTTPESMAIMDVGTLRLAETMELVATGLDVNIVVTVTESFGAYPHDSHRRSVRALADVCNQAHAMEVKQSVLVAKEVQLQPWDKGDQRDKTKATYTFRLLQAPSDHIKVSYRSMGTTGEPSGHRDGPDHHFTG